MITEDYVSFETAKLLKEKGFSENTEHEIWYVIKQFSTGCHWNSCTYKVGDTTREYDDDCCIPMPTLQMAMKWLREEKNILIYVYPVIGLPVKNNYTFYWRWDGKKKRHDAPHIGDKHNYESFEQACEAAIKYCLENLI